MKRVVLVLLLVAGWVAPAPAETGFQFAAGTTRVPDDPHVDGFRISFFHGENERMNGFDFGILSLSSTRDRSGLATIFGVSRTTGTSSGLNAAFMIVHEGEASGVNAGFLNFVKTLKSGLNLGFINVTEGFSSMDLSGIGVSDRSNVQVGFINVTKKIENFQFGFVNIAENGFLPVFPIFNVPKQ